MRQTFSDPPRPRTTLAELRQDTPDAWRVMHYLIDRIIPVVSGYGLPADATRDGVEQLIDAGFLRLEITGRNRKGVTFRLKVWTGGRYERVRL